MQVAFFRSGYGAVGAGTKPADSRKKILPKPKPAFPIASYVRCTPLSKSQWWFSPFWPAPWESQIWTSLAELLRLPILSSLASKRGLGCYESPGGWEVERAKDLWDEVLRLTFTNIAVGLDFLSVSLWNGQTNLFPCSHLRKNFILRSCIVCALQIGQDTGIGGQ